MSTARRYKVTVRHLGTVENWTERTTSYATREVAFAKAAEKLAERLASGRTDPTSLDAVVNGPDADLRTGRILRHDGTQADLLEFLTTAQAQARAVLNDAGWTDADIEAGRKN
jgi:hypothetical protein